MKRVLVLDNQAHRRELISESIRSIRELCVDSRASIDQAAYESGGFHVALVHFNNWEAKYIHDGWTAQRTRCVFFSGSFTAPIAQGDGGMIYASAVYLERPENLRALLQELLQ